jgi:hypothetical protein
VRSPKLVFRAEASLGQEATELSSISFPGMKEKRPSGKVARCYDAHSFPAGEEKVNELLFTKQLVQNYRWQLLAVPCF